MAQGFGWEWGEEKLPAEAPRFNLVMIAYLLFAFVVSLSASIRSCTSACPFVPDVRLATRARCFLGRRS